MLFSVNWSSCPNVSSLLATVFPALELHITISIVELGDFILLLKDYCFILIFRDQNSLVWIRNPFIVFDQLIFHLQLFVSGPAWTQSPNTNNFLSLLCVSVPLHGDITFGTPYRLHPCLEFFFSSHLKFPSPENFG